MESFWLLVTTFRPTVIGIVVFLLLFIVGSLIVWIVRELFRRHRGNRRERRIYSRGLVEIQGRRRRELERDEFFRHVQEIMRDFNK